MLVPVNGDSEWEKRGGKRESENIFLTTWMLHNLAKLSETNLFFKLKKHNYNPKSI